MRKDYVYQDKGQFKLLQNATRIGNFMMADKGFIPIEQVLPEQRFAHQPIFRRPPEVVKSKTYFFLPGDSRQFLTAYYGGRTKSFIAKQEPTDLAIELMKKIFKQEEPVSYEERNYLTDYYLNGGGAQGVWNGAFGWLTGDFDIILIKGWAVFTRYTLDANGYGRAWVYGAGLNGWSSFSIDTPFLLGGVAQNVDTQGIVGAGMIKPILLYKWVQEGATNYGLIILETRRFIVYDLPLHPEGVWCVESFLVQYESVDFVTWGKIEEIFIGSNYPLETRPIADKVVWLSSIIGQRDASDYSNSYNFFEPSEYYNPYSVPLYSQYLTGIQEAFGESYKQALGEYLHKRKKVYGDFVARELGASSNFHFKDIWFFNRAFETKYIDNNFGDVVGAFSIRWGVAFLLNDNDEIVAVNYPGNPLVTIGDIPCPPSMYNKAFYSIDSQGQLKVYYAEPADNPDSTGFGEDPSKLGPNFLVPLPAPEREIPVCTVLVYMAHSESGPDQLQFISFVAGGPELPAYWRETYLWVKRINGATNFNKKYLDM